MAITSTIGTKKIEKDLNSLAQPISSTHNHNQKQATVTVESQKEKIPINGQVQLKEQRKTKEDTQPQKFEKKEVTQEIQMRVLRELHKIVSKKCVSEKEKEESAKELEKALETLSVYKIDYNTPFDLTSELTTLTLADIALRLGNLPVLNVLRRHMNTPAQSHSKEQGQSGEHKKANERLLIRTEPTQIGEAPKLIHQTFFIELFSFFKKASDPNQATEGSLETLRDIFNKYAQYKINYIMPVDSNENTLVGLTLRIIKDIPAGRQLFIHMGIPKDLRVSLEQYNPSMLIILEQALQKKRSFVEKFNSEQLELSNSEKFTRDLERKKKNEKKESAFKKFRDECSAEFKESTDRQSQFSKISNRYSTDFSFEVIHAGKKSEILAKNLKNIFSISLAHTNATLSMFADKMSCEIASILDMVHFYCATETIFSEQNKSVNKKIALLPIGIKEEIQSLVDRDSRSMIKIFKKAKALLAAYSDNYLKQYQLYIPQSWQKEIWTLGDDFSHLDLRKINEDYYKVVLENINKRKQIFSHQLGTFYNLGNSQVAVAFVENERKRILTKHIDDAIQYFIEADKPMNTQSYKKFRSVYRFEFHFMSLIENITLEMRCLGAITSKYWSHPAFNQIISDMAQNNSFQTSTMQNHVSHDEVLKQERKRQKELEQTRREKAQKEAENQKKIVLLDQKKLEEEQKAKKESAAAKRYIVEGMNSLTKEERLFMEVVFKGEDLDKVLAETLIEPLAEKLKLPYRSTKNGGILTIHKQTVSFHHAHDDAARKLRGEFVKNFKNALLSIEITREDLPSATPLTSTPS